MSNVHRDALLEQIRQGSARVGIIGLGYVGLPLAQACATRGFPVLGFDTDPRKVQLLCDGQSYIGHIGPEAVRAMIASGFEPTSDLGRLGEADIVLICVPTPLGETREPDLSFVTNTARAIARTLRPGQLVVLESTTYPGTTRDVVQPILESGGLRAGEDFFLAFSPEREDPGNPDFSAPTIPKVVGGLDPISTELAAAFYEQIVVKVVAVSSAEVAEACKILENTYRAVNIALVNELKILYDRMGIDVWEVIDAAKTKPFGFQAFYPGPGLGGHCLAGEETVRVRAAGLDSVLPLAELFARYAEGSAPMTLGDVEVLECPDLETRSIDPQTLETSWKPAPLLFRRRFRGTMIEVLLGGNRRLRVTDRHPMLVVEEDRLVVREARDLRPGDRVPQFNGPIADPADPLDNPQLDLLDVLPEALVDRLHVRIADVPWQDHEALLKARFGGTIRDAIRKDSLAARRFLELEPELGVGRDQLTLLSGRGSAHTRFPAVLRVTPEFCRLVGYFLSEGCITEDRGNPRVRFTFHRDEVEFIEDVRSILAALGVRVSIYQDRTWHSTTLRVGSIILGHLFRDVLKTGVSSRTMRIPKVVMGASSRHHDQVLAGLLCGDGDVEVHTGLRTYQKAGRTYIHSFNAGQAGYFSSSPELLAQADSLLQELGCCPTLKKGKPHLRLSGQENLSLLAPLFGGAKARRLEHLESVRLRTARPRTVQRWAGGTSLAVVGIVPAPADESVYSLEVPGNHTFATTGGVFVHNCIPIDPFYLSWVARRFGMSTRFIELAGEINTSMPEFVVHKVADALNDRGKPVKGSRIALLGMAYKKDVDDPRESPGFELMELLLARGADVSYHDPHIPVLPSMRKYPNLRMESQPLTPEYLASQDCVLIVTDHSAFDWPWIVAHAPLVIDTRNATRGVTEHRDRIVKA